MNVVCAKVPADPHGVILSWRITDAMPANVLDTWAKERMDEGWTYGPVRDDMKKQHPCLVPYGELPESEKVYDRDTAISTLKLICKMGYRIII